MKDKFEVDSYGIPVNTSMPITKADRLDNVDWGDEKVRGFRQYDGQPRPMEGFLHKVQHSSSEAQWLYNVPKELGAGTYVNLGVFRGGSTACLAYGARDFKVDVHVHGVDIWVHGGKKHHAQEGFDQAGISDYITLHTGFTHEVVKTFQDKKLRFVFVDADHHYETCKRDIQDWSPLVEQGGWISFHDINFPTVDRAIREEIESSDEWVEMPQLFRIRTFKRK